MLTQTFFWIGFSLYVLLVLFVAIIVTLENRQPSRTIAWVSALVFLPGLGLILFFLFGQSIKRERKINRGRYNQLRKRILGVIDKDVAPELFPERYKPLIRMCDDAFWSTPSPANMVDFHDNGHDFFISLLCDIAKARHFIYIESYIFNDDGIGRLLRDALADKVRQGIEIRVIYDDVGCWRVKNSFFEQMEKSGIKVANFLPVRFPSMTGKANYRNHHKICVIDGVVGYIGGMNIAMRYVSSRMQGWRDLQIRVQGDVANQLRFIFLTDWLFATGGDRSQQDIMERLSQDRIYIGTPKQVEEYSAGKRSEVSDALMQILLSSPVTQFPEMMYALTWIIQNARKYIYLQTPYFMPTEPILQALQTAAMSGVDVRIMVPSKPDGRLLRWANDSYVADMLRAGIKVYHFNGGFLHTKMMVSDDDWGTVGSTNIDFRSFENNFEANAFIYNKECAARLKSIFMEDVRQATELKLSQWNKRGFSHKFLESFTRIFSPLF